VITRGGEGGEGAWSRVDSNWGGGGGRVWGERRVVRVGRGLEYLWGRGKVSKGVRRCGQWRGERGGGGGVGGVGGVRDEDGGVGGLGGTGCGGVQVGGVGGLLGKAELKKGEWEGGARGGGGGTWAGVGGGGGRGGWGGEEQCPYSSRFPSAGNSQRLSKNEDVEIEKDLGSIFAKKPKPSGYVCWTLCLAALKGERMRGKKKREKREIVPEKNECRTKNPVSGSKKMGGVKSVIGATQRPVLSKNAPLAAGVGNKERIGEESRGTIS